MPDRRYTPADHVIMQVDQALSTLFGQPRSSHRPSPAKSSLAIHSATPTATALGNDTVLDSPQRRQAARLLRVNHTGEVCAQALYQGQALTARRGAVRQLLEQAALEEGDHLRWCQTRIDELGGRTSRLNPLFYAGSLAVGALAGLTGDRWSLGFLAETEHQVERHLDRHLERLPRQDYKSRALLAAMREDERHHASTAWDAGAARLPLPVRLLMTATSKIMTNTTYWV